MARQESSVFVGCYVFTGKVRDRLQEERAATEDHRFDVATHLLSLASVASTAQMIRHLIEAASAVYMPHSSDEQKGAWRKMSATAARRARILGEEESKLNQF